LGDGGSVAASAGDADGGSVAGSAGRLAGGRVIISEEGIEAAGVGTRSEDGGGVMAHLEVRKDRTRIQPQRGLVNHANLLMANQLQAFSRIKDGPFPEF
jgi:hypothetical protein